MATADDVVRAADAVISADVADASASARAAEILRMRIVDAAEDLAVEK